MACRDAYETNNVTMENTTEMNQQNAKDQTVTVSRLLFGVDSKVQANDILQNNISMFEWVLRNKVYPNFWGRNITGENRLTKEEIEFLHGNGCKIAAICNDNEPKETEEQGKIQAKKLSVAAMELGIPESAAIFLEVEADNNTTRDYLKGFAYGLLSEGYIPGFKTSTDASYGFDREFSRGMQTDKEVFSQCLIWATSPTLDEYDKITTTHLIHPDNWMPYAPSGTTRNEIAVWQYGKDCHPIEDNESRKTVFNIDLVRNENVIVDRMF